MRKFWHNWRWPILGVAAFVAFVGGTLGWRHWSLHQAIETRLQAIRDAGLPVTLADLNAWYPEPPPGENAAELLHDAFSNYLNEEDWQILPGGGNVDLPKRGEALSDDMKAAIEEYLNANAEALKLLHQAAAMKDCRFPIDLMAGFNVRLPHLAQLRGGAKMLRLEAMLRTENGNTDAAVDSIVSILGVANALRQEPILISELVRISCIAIAGGALEYVLNRATPSAEQIARLEQAFLAAEAPGTMFRALVGERCQWFNELDPLLTAGALGRGLNIIGWKKSNQLSYLDMMQGFVEALEKPYPERWKLATEVETAISKLTESGSGMVQRYFEALPTMLLAALPKASLSHARMVASVRAARGALRVERYRAENGVLPETLAGDDIPVDPFNGAPLRYKRHANGKGYVVYSIGEDGQDDGGEMDALRFRKDVGLQIDR